MIWLTVLGVSIFCSGHVKTVFFSFPGIDFFLMEVNDTIRPVAIEVNGHDCTINCQIFDFLANLNFNASLSADPVSTYLSTDLVPSLSRYNHGNVHGRSVRPYVRTMIARSQRFIIKGKTILVIGAGGYSKRNLWPSAAKCGIKVRFINIILSFHIVQINFCSFKAPC